MSEIIKGPATQINLSRQTSANVEVGAINLDLKPLIEAINRMTEMIGLREPIINCPEIYPKIEISMPPLTIPQPQINFTVPDIIMPKIVLPPCPEQPTVVLHFSVWDLLFLIIVQCTAFFLAVLYLHLKG